MRFLLTLLLILTVPGIASAEDDQDNLSEAVEAAQEAVEDGLLPDDDDEPDLDEYGVPTPATPLADFREESEEISETEDLSEEIAELAVERAERTAAAIGAGLASREREVNEVKLQQVERRVEDSAGGAEADLRLNEDFAALDVYGRFAIHARNDKDEFTLRNNSSRFGLEPIVNVGSLVFKGRGEWRINFGVGDEEFNLDTGDVGDSAPPLSTRLGFIGFTAGDYGAIYFGKQWSVFYDISGWTDQFVVFGGAAAGVFNSGTDGGALGTGRVDSAATYRFKYAGVEFGMQGQFTNGRQRFLDGFAVALAYNFDFGLSAGIAYNHAFLNSIATSTVLGSDDDDARILNAALKYKRGQFYIAALFAASDNTEIATIGEENVTYRTLGVELIAEYAWEFGLSLYGGTNLAQWTSDSELVSEDAGTRDFIMGAKFYLGKYVFLYTETRLTGSRDVFGEIAPSVGTLGLRLDYSLFKFLQNQ